MPERAAAAAAAETRYSLAATAGPQLYADIDTVVAERLSTGIGEFDRVLGGGVVPGSLVLHWRRAGHRQVDAAAAGGGALRARRSARCSTARARNPSTRSSRAASGSASSAAPLYILAETCLERILEEIARLRPAFVIVDSIQTVFSLKFQSAPGSIGQVRESATQLLFAAKGQNIPTFLVGHVTKDGSLAGPKALEHIVDTVLYFEGEKHHAHRVVRAVKNRFGAVSELGVFEMTGTRPAGGAEPVASCSSPSGRPSAPGSAVLCCVEGSRPLLVEVQALVSTQLVRQRAADGERARSEPAVAAAGRAREARRPEPDRRGRVRQRRGRHCRRRAGRGPGDHRRRRVEPAQPADSRRNRRVRRGRSGRRESRGVTQAALRVREAAQMGFTRCVVPDGNCSPERRRRAGMRAGRGQDRAARRSSS